MGSKLIIEPEARDEIYDAIDWYQSKQIGLGEEFYGYLEGYFETLKNGNSDFPIKRKPVFREITFETFSLRYYLRKDQRSSNRVLCIQYTLTST